MSATENQPAPDFELDGSDGKKHKLSQHKGSPVVIYFYPKDDTPGCTTQACDFRDNLARVQGAGAVLYGISRDSLGSHDKFIKKYDLTFTLLTDPEKTVHQLYGAWGEKNMYGKKTMGVIRSTFLIDAEGTLVKAWRNVRAKGHADKVLAELEGLSK